MEKAVRRPLLNAVMLRSCSPIKLKSTINQANLDELRRQLLPLSGETVQVLLEVLPWRNKHHFREESAIQGGRQADTNSENENGTRISRTAFTSTHPSVRPPSCCRLISSCTGHTCWWCKSIVHIMIHHVIRVRMYSNSSSSTCSMYSKTMYKVSVVAYCMSCRATTQGWRQSSRRREISLRQQETQKTNTIRTTTTNTQHDRQKGSKVSCQHQHIGAFGNGP